MNVEAMTEKQRYAKATRDDASTRLEEARSIALAQMDVYHDTLVATDLDACLSVDDRVNAEEKLMKCERQTDEAWERFQAAYTRYVYAVRAAQDLGVA